LVYCVKINLATLFQRTATKWNGFCWAKLNQRMHLLTHSSPKKQK
jgi:hypothetical protein